MTNCIKWNALGNVDRIIISRTDSIGDVMLTLPLAGALKQQDPDRKVLFLCKDYTAPVVACCEHVDGIISYEQLEKGNVAYLLKERHADAIVHVFPKKEVATWAKQVSIPTRIGTSHRAYHLLTCNKLVNFTRRRSELHEAQLNFKLLKPLGIGTAPDLDKIRELYGFKPPGVDVPVREALRNDRKNIILHPGSKGSAVEWGLKNFAALISGLDPARFHVLITGTDKEGQGFRAELPVDLEHVSDVSGKLSLQQLIALIGASDALVAASTGPLHIAAASSIRAIGLYSQRRPIHPGRWAPLGRDVHALTQESICGTCAKGNDCDCIQRIPPEQVKTLLDQLCG